MTDKEFITWLKGFVEACHEYAPTPKQWDTIKDKLKEVNNGVGVSIGIGGTGTANATTYPTFATKTFTALHTTTTDDKHLLND